jgi:multidrug efflux pump subunit AcrA (membrane-fusion protein)
MLTRLNTKAIVCVLSLLMHATVFADEIPPIDCMIEPNLMVEVSSPVEGVLDTLTIDRSDEVIKGQVIATIKSDVEQVNVKISQERLKLSQVENKRAADLYRKKVITLTERDQLENEMKLYELDLENAKANLALRQVKSPIDGVVVKRYFSQGEFVESRPIIKLAQLDPLKIEVISLVSNYGKIVKGMRARIEPEHGDYPELVADVVVVDKVIDAASGTFGVRLELPNKDHSIPSGLKCKVYFLPPEVSADKVQSSSESYASNSTLGVASVADIDNESVSNSPSMRNDLMCSSIGPYKNQSEFNTLIAELETDINHTGLRTETEEKITYLIVSNEFNTLQETRSAMQQMKADGVTDMAMMNKAGKYRIALGLYSQKSSAINRLDVLQKKGYQAQMKPKQRKIKTYWADITYSPALEDMLSTLIPSSHRNSCIESIRLSLLNNEL